MNHGLILKDVTVRVANRTLLDGVSLAVDPSELVVLVGPNGAGKTTLLRTALGLVRPASGEVLLAGSSVGRFGSRARAAQVAWLPQHPLPGEALTAVDLVTAARYRFAETVRSSRDGALRALSQVEACRYAHRRVGELSGGERQRVALAVALAQEAPLLLLDEPANHLDPAHQIEIYELIGTLRQQGHGILCVTHDLNLVRFATDATTSSSVRVVGIAGGRIRFRHGLSSMELVADLDRLFDVKHTAIDVDREQVLVVGRGHAP